MSADTKDLVLTKELWEGYLDFLTLGERKTQTIRIYRRCMEELYDFLPDGKEITGDTLGDWKSSLKIRGYSEKTINLRLTAANGLMKFCGMSEYTVPHERTAGEGYMPELTRAEYLQFLSAARRRGNEQEYLLIKLFASADIRIHELQYLTVESCRTGEVEMPDGRMSMLPPSLGREIADYAERQGVAAGPVFVTRSGNPLDRSNISRSIRQLAQDAGMDPEKCCPRALHRVYRTTREELMRRILPIYLQTYDNLLNTEQAFMAMQ